MESVTPIVVPVFGLALLGYAATRMGWFTRRAAEGLARFVFDFAVPLMLVRVLAATHLPEALPWRPFASFYIPAALCYAGGLLAFHRGFGRSFNDAVIGGFCCSFGNSVLLGLPLALLALGQDGMVSFLLLLSVHGLSYFTATTVLLEYGRSRGDSARRLASAVLRGLATNPIVLGLTAGVVLNWSGAAIPLHLDRILESMQQAVPPCSLFALGASLARHRVAGRIGEPVFAASVKVFVLPASVAVTAVGIFGLDHNWAAAATLLAAQPTGVHAWLFAERYAAGREVATSTVLISTATALVTIPALLAVLGRL